MIGPARMRPERIVWPRPGGLVRAPRALSAVVVGGGIAGVAAAVILCERGVSVTLIEREPFLGGRAGGWTERLASGREFQMERGFHAFFRQYYNLRRLLRRIDPGLDLLAPVDDYPILGPAGTMQSFRNLPRRTPLQLVSLVRRTPYLGVADLVRINKRAALAMLAFEMKATYARFDHVSARCYLDSLGFSPTARRMLFDVFSHSFFNAEAEMSAAELLMMFHFYFTGNPEGLIFDVARRPLSTAIWRPLGRWLRENGARSLMGARADRVERSRAGWRVRCAGGTEEAELLVLALPVDGLQRLVRASPDLDDPEFRRRIRELCCARPFAVWRLWLDRPVRSDRAPFVGTTGIGLLDNISVYERLEDESAELVRETGGSIVELHAYALRDGIDEPALKRDLLAGMHALYPETRDAAIVDERFLWRRDCPGFPPGSHALRPTVATRMPGVAVCGDLVKLPIPSALMERAATSGMLAANALLAPHRVRPEPVWSVPRRGLLASLF